MTTTNSRAMHMAHIMHKDKPRFPWSEIMRRAWYFIHFRQALQQGFATFSFYKQDGSIREAKGTLFWPLIPQDKWPKETNVDHISKPNYSTITFFDLDKQEWRSFDICRFIGFVTLYQISEGSIKEKEAKRKQKTMQRVSD